MKTRTRASMAGKGTAEAAQGTVFTPEQRGAALRLIRSGLNARRSPELIETTVESVRRWSKGEGGEIVACVREGDERRLRYPHGRLGAVSDVIGPVGGDRAQTRHSVAGHRQREGRVRAGQKEQGPGSLSAIVPPELARAEERFPA
jgi:hypothetical protein